MHRKIFIKQIYYKTSKKDKNINTSTLKDN